MRTTLKILAVIVVAVMYRYIPNSDVAYIFRYTVGLGMMFMIVPSVFIKIWNEKLVQGI